jgi:hypothetical protein
MAYTLLDAKINPLFSDAFTGHGGVPAVPLVLGVVGHRDVQEGDSTALKARLVELFLQFRVAYKHTPLLVTTSLAQGRTKPRPTRRWRLGLL